MAMRIVNIKVYVVPIVTRSVISGHRNINLEEKSTDVYNAVEWKIGTKRGTIKNMAVYFIKTNIIVHLRWILDWNWLIINDIGDGHGVNAKESLDLFWIFAFSFREIKKSKQCASDAEAAEHPKDSWAANGVLNVDEGQSDDESHQPVSKRSQRAARCFDFGG